MFRRKKSGVVSTSSGATASSSSAAPPPPPAPVAAPAPAQPVTPKSFEFPEEDDAERRERWERRVACAPAQAYRAFASFVFVENAGVATSWVEVTKPSSDPVKKPFEVGMERNVAGFVEEITTVEADKMIEYQIKDGPLKTSYHKGRVTFKPDEADKNATHVVWTIWWSPESVVTGLVYSMVIKGWIPLAMRQLDQKISTGEAETIANEESAAEEPEEEAAEVDATADRLALGALKEGEQPKLQWAARLMTGYEGNLTPDQAAALDQMRHTLQTSDPDTWRLAQAHPDGPDRIMLRFLRAECSGRLRKFNVDKSIKRLSHTLHWREKIGANEWITNPPEHYERFLKVGAELEVMDREGRVVAFLRAGILSTCMDLKRFSEEQWIQGLVALSERRMQIIRESSKRLGHEVSAMVTVYDLAGVGFSSRKIIPFAKLINSVASVHYPEFVDVIFLVNAPAIFASLYAAIKGFLDEVTRSKVCIFGHSASEKRKYEAALRAVIDPKNLPIEYGGESPVLAPYPEDYKR